jgi:hypothetical protein
MAWGFAQSIPVFSVNFLWAFDDFLVFSDDLRANYGHVITLSNHLIYFFRDTNPETYTAVVFSCPWHPTWRWRLQCLPKHWKDFNKRRGSEWLYCLLHIIFEISPQYFRVTLKRDYYVVILQCVRLYRLGNVTWFVKCTRKEDLNWNFPANMMFRSPCLKTVATENKPLTLTFLWNRNLYGWSTFCRFYMKLNFVRL